MHSLRLLFLNYLFVFDIETASPKPKMVFIPPSFNDIGKAAKDLFSKGFCKNYLLYLIFSCYKLFVFVYLDLGEVKVEHKSKTRSGLDFTASGTLPRDSDRMTGSLETKYAIKQYALYIQFIRFLNVFLI